MACAVARDARRRPLTRLWMVVVAVLVAVVSFGVLASSAFAAPPTIEKSFGSRSISLNESTSLTFTITNPNPNGGNSVSGIGFTDNLQAGLVVATPNGVTNSCGGSMVAVAGSSSISLSGVSLPANSVCKVSVSVSGVSTGVKYNSVTVTSDGGTGDTSNASITVLGAADAGPFFSTGNPDGKIAMASRSGPGAGPDQQTETGDDFSLGTTTSVSRASFVGLLPTGAPLSSIQQVGVEIYRVFPNDSNTMRAPQVPTRTNSPSDVELGSRVTPGGLTYTASALNPSFGAANSVDTGINPLPSQTTGGEGPVTGEEVAFDITFSTPFTLPSGQYFFVPQVLLSSGHFFWLSAPRPIVSPGTPFTSDVEAWIRNASLNPDWLRVGSDIVGGASFNAVFSLTSCPTIVVSPAALPAATVGRPYTVSLSASGGSAPYNFTETGTLPSGASLASDGTVSGTPSQSGSFPLTITATDAHGCLGTNATSLTVGNAPGSGGSGGGGIGGGGGTAGNGGGGAAVLAAVGTVSLSPTTFAAAPRGPSATAARRRYGTKVAFTLNEPASVVFSVVQRSAGRRSPDGRCVKPTKSHRGARKCTRFASIRGRFTRAATTGANSFHFTGRLAGLKLKPGNYTLIVTPRAGGKTGRRASASFRITN